MKHYILIYLLLILVCSCNKKGIYNHFEEKKYQQLESIVLDTKTSLANYLNATKEHARSICTDDVMTSFFLAKRDYYSLKKDTVLPASIEYEVTELKKKIQHYYLLHYLNFYDILFIDTTGDIFYTIRKQENYHKNLFKGKLAKTSLSANLKEKNGESYIDFDFYNMSAEPSAFFIEPLTRNNKTEGWFVLQCSIKKINRIFKRNEHLGATGEALLVNKNHYLLTDSRFNVKSTILKQRLPKENIESKFMEEKGRKKVVDYRGKEVISAFDTFNFFGKEWLIIAKIDSDEIRSNYYLEFEETQYPYLLGKILEIDNEYDQGFSTDKKYIAVEMDEFARAENGQILFTQGVSTCTALIASFPGKFSYMAHISPYDAIYNQTKTDITDNMLKEISYFDITRAEKEKMKFEIVLTQPLALRQAIHKLLSEGFFLSQITVLCNANAEYANIYYDTEANCSNVNWKVSNASVFIHTQSKTPSLATVFETQQAVE